ncbi:unnamed protein product [Ceutorhynchus assimilis]|uniref:Regulatory protein zeste n=1 Tax=Ceutorhynchus assimilis TaxID=467358 RepID=A0A9N9MFY8_9CUCU|nr:unnamed protein product [Ceutorhynchus assimilis]CAG9763552.1 unnamed protein product [Ceutorhynchus assimilis]
MEQEQNPCQDTSSSKKRAPNYANNEKEYLLNLIEKYKNIIENKKTDGVSVKEKKETWEKICQEFNSASPSLHYRPMESLKKTYEKMKEEIRKKTAELKKELYKTGGGPGPCPEPNKNSRHDELLMSIMSKKSVFGLGSQFDSNMGVNLHDAGHDMQNNLKSSAATGTLLYDTELSDVENNNEEVILIKCSLIRADDPKPFLNRTTKSTQTQANETEASTQSHSEVPSCSRNISNDIEIIYEQPESQPSHVWKKSENLKRPISSVLKGNIDKTTQGKKKFENSSRRRPNTVVPLTSSRLGEKYELLVDKKLELVECLKKEHQLRMEALQLDIQLKKKHLSSIAYSKDSNECLLESQMLY